MAALGGAAAHSAQLRAPCSQRWLLRGRAASAGTGGRGMRGAGARAQALPPPSPADVAENGLFEPLRGSGARTLGAEIDVPRLHSDTKEATASPFCTFSACALPAGPPRSGPRNSVNLHHAFVSDEDRVLLKSISYGNATSAGAEDCDADCNFTPRWCVRLPAVCGATSWLLRRPCRCVRAGPRASLYFKPQEVKAAIVTCGGLCPGLNDVIRQIVTTLESGYGVQDIVGIPYGYRGFFEEGLEVRTSGPGVHQCAPDPNDSHGCALDSHRSRS